MTRTSRLLLKIARWLAGRDRAEWVDAMEAEATTTEGASTAWAFGCVWGSAKDRLAKDWWFIAAIIVLPTLAFIWKQFVFFSTSSWLVEQRIPAWLAVACWILSPFPLAFLFAQWRQGTPSYVAVAVSFVIVEATPMLMMLSMGVPVGRWFGPNVNWYKADPGITIGVPVGITLDLLAWLTAAWLGSAFRRRITSPA